MQNKILKILLGLIAAAAAGAAIYLETTVEIPVLKNDVSAGEIIEASNIDETRQMKSAVSDGIVSEAIQLVGKEAVYSLPAFTPIPESSIKEQIREEDIIPSDDVIVPIEVAAQRVPSSLKEGDIVNVMAYFQQGTVEDAPAFLVGINEKAKVITVRKDDAGNITGVDVSIRKDVAPKISASNAMGMIYIIRNVTDNDVLLDAITAREIYEEGFSAGAAVVISEGNEVKE